MNRALSRTVLTLENDYDYRVVARETSIEVNQLDSANSKLKHYLRHFDRPHCGCEHDCCGCLTGYKYTFEAFAGKVYLVEYLSFNY